MPQLWLIPELAAALEIHAFDIMMVVVDFAISEESYPRSLSSMFDPTPCDTYSILCMREGFHRGVIRDRRLKSTSEGCDCQ